jgi:hypothetical protein
LYGFSTAHILTDSLASPNALATGKPGRLAAIYIVARHKMPMLTRVAGRRLLATAARFLVNRDHARRLVAGNRPRSRPARLTGKTSVSPGEHQLALSWAISALAGTGPAGKTGR